MPVLVTGGAGFIGSHLIRRLIRRGERVVVLDLGFDRAPIREILEPAEIRELTLVRADTADPVAVSRVVREQGVRSVVHLAMLYHDRADADPWEGVRVNVQGTLTFFEAARLFDIDRVVFASSVQVFGRPTAYSRDLGSGLVDDGPQRPYSVYSASKSLVEFMAGHYHRRFNLDTRGLRPCGTFGPGRGVGRPKTAVATGQPDLVVTSYLNDMIEAAALGVPFTVPQGERALPHAYVDDTARAFESALYYDGDEMSGRTLNIGGFLTTHRRFTDIVRAVVPEASIEVLNGDGGEPFVAPIDNSALRRLTGFDLEVSLEEGVRRTVEFIRRKAAGASSEP